MWSIFPREIWCKAAKVLLHSIRILNAGVVRKLHWKLTDMLLNMSNHAVTDLMRLNSMLTPLAWMSIYYLLQNVVNFPREI